jgi:ribose-phosphate pyrophosphokinase
MSAPLIVALPGNDDLAARLARGLGAELAGTEFRRFPDGESYVRFDTDVAGRSLVLACTLDRPDEKFLTLMFAAMNARELGAARVGLVAPYLAYLRQDKRFKPGEAVTSTLFARLLSGGLDWLATIDPHLHRLSALDAIYPIPTRVQHAAPLVARWIAKRVSQPLLIGPDMESEQWVGAIAAECGAPHIVLEKRRRGDRAVDIFVPDMRLFQDRTPVLVDDIISSARTMIETLSQLRKAGMKPAICVGVHAVFGAEAHAALRAAGATGIATTNTIPHETNDIDVTPLLAEAVRTFA